MGREVLPEGICQLRTRKSQQAVREQSRIISQMCESCAQGNDKDQCGWSKGSLGRVVRNIKVLAVDPVMQEPCRSWQGV